MIKKLIILLMVTFTVFSFAGCGDNKSEAAKGLEDDYGLSSGFHSSKESSWLVTSTSNSAANDPRDWALAYYNEYGSDVDVIWVINFANHTTTQLRNDSSDGLLLHVLQMDGSEDVESSLNKGNVYSGMVLAEYYIYEEDGNVKVEDLTE